METAFDRELENSAQNREGVSLRIQQAYFRWNETTQEIQVNKRSLALDTKLNTEFLKPKKPATSTPPE